MTKRKFLKYLLVAITYVVVIGFVLPFLMSAKSTIASILGIAVGVSFIIVIPAFLLINHFNESSK